MNAVSSNLKELRAAAGLTQDALAERLHVTRQTISNWETGRSEPDLQVLEELAEALGADVTELIYGKKEPEYERMQKKYVRVCIVLGIVLTVCAVLHVTLRPYLHDMARIQFNARPIWAYNFGVPAICLAAFSALICALLSLGLDLRLKKPWSWIALLCGIACLAPALTSAAEFLIWQFFYPDLGAWKPVFNFPPEYYSLFVYILPFLGGIGVFLGCNRK
ncbi:MAG: helix-turn-helix transcriptional regulator [Firmicutes bacterium]|nr:helix-turn-helix transcriptional regulator [Bacillota bacterium]